MCAVNVSLKITSSATVLSFSSIRLPTHTRLLEVITAFQFLLCRSTGLGNKCNSADKWRVNNRRLALEWTLESPRPGGYADEVRAKRDRP